MLPSAQREATEEGMRINSIISRVKQGDTLGIPLCGYHRRFRSRTYNFASRIKVLNIPLLVELIRRTDLLHLERT